MIYSDLFRSLGDTLEDDDEEAKEDEDEEDSKKKKKKAGISKSGTLDEKTKKVLACHPLKVVLQVKLKNHENMVLLTFSHLTELQVVSLRGFFQNIQSNLSFKKAVFS